MPRVCATVSMAMTRQPSSALAAAPACHGMRRRRASASATGAAVTASAPLRRPRAGRATSGAKAHSPSRLSSPASPSPRPIPLIVDGVLPLPPTKLSGAVAAPIAKRKPELTGWPSTESTRQRTVYVPRSRPLGKAAVGLVASRGSRLRGDTGEAARVWSGDRELALRGVDDLAEAHAHAAGGRGEHGAGRRVARDEGGMSTGGCCHHGAGSPSRAPARSGLWPQAPAPARPAWVHPSPASPPSAVITECRGGLSETSGPAERSGSAPIQCW